MSDNDSLDSLYLKKVQFDKTTEKSLMGFLLRNPRLVILMIIALVISGIFSYFSLPREVNPEVQIPIISVRVAYPGANPNDVEELVIKPIEKQLEDLSSVDSIDSQANPSFGFINVTFKSTQDTDLALSEVKNKVDLAVLPDEVIAPVVEKLDFTKVPVMQIVISGNMERASLSKIAEDFSNTLEDAPTISKVETLGRLNEDVRIDLDVKKLQEFGLTPTQVVQTLKGNDVSFPSGQININGIKYQVTVDNKFKAIDDVRNQIININGKPIPLQDIADIRFESKENPTSVYFSTKESDNLPAIQLDIFKSKGSKVTDAALEIDEIIKTLNEKYKNIQITKTTDVADEINVQFGDLFNDLITTAILVFIVLLLFLGVKNAIIAPLSLPLVLASTFTIMSVTGITLNFLSLFSLLLAIGMVVDDAIVIVTAYTSYSQSPNFKTSTEAGLMVYRDFLAPIWTTTITTVWAFVPLLMSTGIIGEFIKSIPIVVSATLLSSTGIAVFLILPLTTIVYGQDVPKRVKNFFVGSGFTIFGIIIFKFIVIDYLGYTSQYSAGLRQFIVILRIFLTIALFVASIWIYKNRKSFTSRIQLKNQSQELSPDSFFYKLWNTGLIDLTRVQNAYKKILERILFDNRIGASVITATIVFIIVSVGFVVSGITKNEFFPKDKSKQIYVNIIGPSGWSEETLKSEVEKIETISTNLAEVENIETVYGSNVQEDGQLQLRNNYAFLVLNLDDPDSRIRKDAEILSEFKENVAKDITIETQAFLIGGGGPPAGADIQVNVFGADLETLENISNQFAAKIKENPNASNVRSSLIASPGEISIHLSPVELAKRNISAIEVASWLRTLIEGTKIGEIDTSDDSEIILTTNDGVSINRIENLVFPSMTGSYSLSEIAEIKLETSPESISRKDGERVVSVTASAEGKSSVELNEELTEKFEEIAIPEGYHWSVGGTNEQNTESTQAIISQMRVAFVLILVTVILLLNSFRKAFLVLGIIPLAIAGVFFNFTLLGIPLSFPSLIGVMSLFGIVAYNSIMLMDKINQNHKIGLGFVEGIVDACISRTEPIFFTTITNLVGLLPITLSDPIWRGLGGAIISGLSVSGILILFILPILYKFFFEKDFKAELYKK